MHPVLFFAVVCKISSSAMDAILNRNGSVTNFSIVLNFRCTCSQVPVLKELRKSNNFSASFHIVRVDKRLIQKLNS